jgi:hypothetical protein
MTVAELKRTLEGVPDSIEVIIVMGQGFGAWKGQIKIERIGFWQLVRGLMNPCSECLLDTYRLHCWVSFAGVVKAPTPPAPKSIPPIMEFRISNGGHHPALLMDDPEDRKRIAAEYVGPRQLPAGQEIVKR